jgi:non-specific serine/threonine protein kinase/serine/threonine-protein kinase
VQEFSEDIRRHLEGLPVTASPDTFGYRVGKFVQRHKAGVVAAAVLLITLCIATGITAWQARVARKERDKAQSRFNQVRKLANKVLFEYSDGIEKLDGSSAVRGKMAKDASEYLDALSQEAAGDAGLQTELATAYQKLGDVQGGSSQANLGDRDGAIRSYRKALAILESLRSAKTDKAVLLDIAGLHGKLHQTLWKMGQQPEAEQHFQGALSIREQLAAAEPANVSYKLALARSYRDFGGLLASKTNKDSGGAIANYRRSNDLCESIIAADNANLEARAIAGLGYRLLGGEFEGNNDAAQALSCYRKALWLTQEREKLDPNNAQIQIVLADCYSNIGRALMLQRDDSGALENFNRALTVFEGRFAKEPENALLLMNLSQTYNNLGNAMAQSGKFAEALENYRRALGLRESYVKSHPSETGFRPRLGETMFDLGELYLQKAADSRTPAHQKPESWREAKSWFQRSLVIWQDLSKEGTLPGYQRDKPDETAKAIARCDAALTEAKNPR